MAREFKISTTPLKEFQTCSNCILKLGLREANTPRTIAVTVTSMGEKGISKKRYLKKEVERIWRDIKTFPR
nr:1471_t:CDS:2 [Entrophospora candida]